MTLAPYVAILGRGKGRARSLTLDEARAAMQVIMSGKAEPEALGALLMLLRMKGETAEEIAGLTLGARDGLGPWPGVSPTLDWPSYAAGRTRGLPWFLLSARLVAASGRKVLLHGWNSHQSPVASVRRALSDLGIAQAVEAADASALMARDGIAYLPLEALSPELMRLVGLRDTFGLRSCINTVLRMLNPALAEAAVQGVFHPVYREIQRDAAALMSLPNLTVLKGGGGEFEHHAVKDISTFGLRASQVWEGATGAAPLGTRRLADAPSDPAALPALWDGTLTDDFATEVVIRTAALALETTGSSDGLTEARALWAGRNTARAA